jgi:hypothetical protein
MYGNVDLQLDPPEVFASKLVGEFQAAGITDRTTIHSFD